VATPGSSELTAETIDLMRELNRTCRQMQQRVVVLIEQLADEQVKCLRHDYDNNWLSVAVGLRLRN